MDDFNELPLQTPEVALKTISDSTATKAQKLLAASLVTQSRVFEYQLTDDAQPLLILDVTHFLNHRINSRLMAAIGQELAEKITDCNPDIILTAPSSGNIPAITTALHLETQPDVVYAPKGTPITMAEVYQAKSRSYTHGKSVDLTVAKDCLQPNQRVVICDDFLDTGRTSQDLLNIVKQAESIVTCFFFVIEKPFGGREQLKSLGFSDDQIISLIKIDSLRPGKLKLNGFAAWFELKRV
ncbi:TPA: hypothetical protein DIV55_03875 [Patescibacteria group bacterium]|uniref:Xanthine phosphoribosyltransferase n=1 Tax=Candidatus Gottesmanbacteria bacterium GW2011_GWA1_43_11 TaxID=1618436 RepID=A0A0G1FBA1_9BACT|nr:MAG: xanthine phosphoribosyltransferase [Candidatus Gottesmanbacteria bacterium GW2011_GWA1_43_11]HCS78858.1 hypothetical protein [Patescibacteria group bacterium]